MHKVGVYSTRSLLSIKQLFVLHDDLLRDRYLILILVTCIDLLVVVVILRVAFLVFTIFGLIRASLLKVALINSRSSILFQGVVAADSLRRVLFDHEHVLIALHLVVLCALR